MRLNTKKYQELMAEQELTPEIICKSTGLGARSFQWIMANGFASEDAVERLAEAAGAQVGELLLPDISRTTENAIEFIKHSKRATVTFSQGGVTSQELRNLQRSTRKNAKSWQLIRVPERVKVFVHISLRHGSGLIREWT